MLLDHGDGQGDVDALDGVDEAFGGELAEGTVVGGVRAFEGSRVVAAKKTRWPEDVEDYALGEAWEHAEDEAIIDVSSLQIPGEPGAVDKGLLTNKAALALVGDASLIDERQHG